MNPARDTATATPEAETPRALVAEGITLGYGGAPVISGLDLEVPTGAITSIIGPNGCGKSTLLRGLSRLLAPTTGRVTLDGQDIHAMPQRELATLIGLLPQSPLAPDGLSVGELVGRGRHPHQSWLRQWSRSDGEVVQHAMELTRTTDLADRQISDLSGGQRQRAWIAMVLAQETQTLLLDEPTTYLDLAHSIEVLDLVTALRRDLARTVVMVVHDLNLAVRTSDHLVVMHAGRIVASGDPADVVTPELLREVFRLEVLVVEDPVTGGPIIVPVRALD